RREGGRDDRRGGRDQGRDRREGGNDRVVGMGDHVPDFILRSFRIETATASEDEGEILADAGEA
ncbi:DEAD/DEAH box helicase, partial [Cereibacter changlensis]